MSSDQGQTQVGGIAASGVSQVGGREGKQKPDVSCQSPREIERRTLSVRQNRLDSFDRALGLLHH